MGGVKDMDWKMVGKVVWAIIKIIGIIGGVVAGGSEVKEAFGLSHASSALYSNSSLTATTTGDAVCLPKFATDVALYLKAVNGAGSSPTLDVVIEHSDDQSNWFTLDTFTQATTGTSLQLKSQNSSSTHILKCLRAKMTIGGTSSPAYNVSVKAFYGKNN